MKYLALFRHAATDYHPPRETCIVIASATDRPNPVVLQAASFAAQSPVVPNLFKSTAPFPNGCDDYSNLVLQDQLQSAGPGIPENTVVEWITAGMPLLQPGMGTSDRFGFAAQGFVTVMEEEQQKKRRWW